MGSVSCRPRARRRNQRSPIARTPPRGRRSRTRNRRCARPLPRRAWPTDRSTRARRRRGGRAACAIRRPGIPAPQGGTRRRRSPLPRTSRPAPKQPRTEATAGELRRAQRPPSRAARATAEPSAAGRSPAPRPAEASLPRSALRRRATRRTRARSLP